MDRKAAAGRGAIHLWTNHALDGYPTFAQLPTVWNNKWLSSNSGNSAP